MSDDCREAFEKKFKTLDLAKTRDAWDRTIYAHSHIQAMFEGYEAAWNARTPTGDAQGEARLDAPLHVGHATFGRGVKISTAQACIDRHMEELKAYRDKDPVVQEMREKMQILQSSIHDDDRAALSAPKIDFEGLNERTLGLKYGDNPEGLSYAAGFRFCLDAVKAHIAAKYPHLKEV